MAENDWLVGETRTLKAKFTPDAEQDPPTEPVKVYISRPDGTYPVVGDNATKVAGSDPAEYTIEHTPDMPGEIHVSFFSDNGGAEETDYTIKRVKSKANA